MTKPAKTAGQTAAARLLKAVRERGGTSDGCGIGTADHYVRDTIACGEDLCRVRFGSLDGSHVVAKAAKRLTYHVPGMEPTGGVKLASSVDLPDNLVVPPRTLGVFRNVVTTTREDRDRDVLHTKGARPDPKMPLLWQHIHTLPIGKMLAVDSHTDDMLAVWTALLDLNDMTEDAARLIEAGALRISHGFLPDRWDERKSVAGDNSNRPVGYDVWDFAIMEESLVSVPSNVDAEITLFSRGQLKNEHTRSHAKALFDARAKQSPGVSFDEPTELPADASNGESKDGGMMMSQGGEGEGEDDAEESMFVGAIDGSWEKAQKELCDTLPAFLLAAGVESMGSHVVGTFAGYAVVCVCMADGSESYHQCDWSDVDGKAAWSGVPTEVTIAVTVSPKSAIVSGIRSVKSGRTLSKANLGKLSDAQADLAELAGTDLTRAQKALVRSAVESIGAVIASASASGDDEGDKATETTKATDHTSPPTPACGCKSAPLDRVGKILATLDAGELGRVRDACSAILATEAQDKIGKAYRELLAG